MSEGEVAFSAERLPPGELGCLREYCEVLDSASALRILLNVAHLAPQTEVYQSL